MSNAIMFISYGLVKGASVPDFLLASETFNNEYMSKEKGYISWKQLSGGETWVDLLTWETMEDAQRVLEPSGTNDLAEKFYSFIDMDSCIVQLFTVERSYQL
jgi:hypothetical protein